MVTPINRDASAIRTLQRRVADLEVENGELRGVHMERWASTGVGFQPDFVFHTHNKENNMSNISTKEQVEVRTQMADVIKEAVEAKYGKVRTWVETEQVGPMGGISAKVLGAVEHNGVIVPFAIQVYSDARIVEALEEQLETDAENDKLRERLGW